MNNKSELDEHFNLGSFLPLFLFVIGVYIIYLIIVQNLSLAMILMLVAFVLYIINNIIVNKTNSATIFNEYLEDMAVYLTFVVSTIIFGIFYYKDSLLVLGVLFFYAMCFVLSLSRNWVLRIKNSQGFPAVLNGLFFPLLYYIWRFYLGEPAESIFLFYYVIVGIFSVSSINFLGHDENTKERF